MANTQQPTHQITVGGRVNVNDQVIACPQCSADQGLTFATFSADSYVRGSCPSGHVWDEHRVFAKTVREVARRANR